MCKCKYHIIHSPSGLFRDNLQHLLRDFARPGQSPGRSYFTPLLNNSCSISTNHVPCLPKINYLHIATNYYNYYLYVYRYILEAYYPFTRIICQTTYSLRYKFERQLYMVFQFEEGTGKKVRQVRFGSRGPSELLISYRNALTEKAAIQGKGKLRGEQLASKVYDCIGNNEHRFHIVSLSIIPKKKTN